MELFHSKDLAPFLQKHQPSPRQKELLDFARRYIAEQGFPPTYRDALRSRCVNSFGSMDGLVKKLRRKNLLPTVISYKQRALTPCTPIITTYVKSRLTWNQSTISPVDVPNTYGIQVCDRSLSYKHIKAGDIIFVDEDGRVVSMFRECEKFSC